MTASHTRTLSRVKRNLNKKKKNKDAISFKKYVIALILVGFSTGVYVANLSSKSEILDKENAKMQMNIKKLEIDINNCNIKKGRFTEYIYILAKINEFKLNLRDPKIQQVKNMKIINRNNQLLLTEPRRIQITQR